MKNRFIVSFGNRRWTRDTLDHAIKTAREQADENSMIGVVAIWDTQRNVIVGVFTDDADGLTFHVFSWPNDIPKPADPVQAALDSPRASF